MQFIANQIWIKVLLPHDILVLQIAIIQLVVVVRNQHFFLANKLPVVLVRRAVVHVNTVSRAQSVGAKFGVVVGNFRCSQYAALTRVVLPGKARFLDLIKRLMN
ncbi:hypothetical protein D9M68_500150 [compost metagenome]